MANTSHELRTPLNGMIGFLRLVLDDMADDDEERTEFIQESHNSALHLLRLINDVLDIAKIEAGKMDLELSAVSLPELLNELGQSMRPQIERRGLAFDIVLPATLDEIKIYSNYQRLKQVLLNLVGNAMKFTHEGGITVAVEIKPQPADFAGQVWPGRVKIGVADTGHWCIARKARPPVSNVLSGRQRPHPSVRRYRAGPGNFSATGRSHGRQSSVHQHG